MFPIYILYTILKDSFKSRIESFEILESYRFNSVHLLKNEDSFKNRNIDYGSEQFVQWNYRYTSSGSLPPTNRWKLRDFLNLRICLFSKMKHVQWDQVNRSSERYKYPHSNTVTQLSNSARNSVNPVWISSGHV